METYRLRSEVQENSTLRDSIIALCKAMIPFKSQLTIQGVIGITIDNTDVILLDVREKAVLNIVNPTVDTEPQLHTIQTESVRFQKQTISNTVNPPIDTNSHGNIVKSEPVGFHSDPVESSSRLLEVHQSHSAFLSMPVKQEVVQISVSELDQPSGSESDWVNLVNDEDECIESNETEYHNDDYDESGEHGKYKHDSMLESSDANDQYTNHNLTAFYLPRLQSYSVSKHDPSLGQGSAASLNRGSQQATTVRQTPQKRSWSKYSGAGSSHGKLGSGGISNPPSDLLPCEVGTMYTCSVCGKHFKRLFSLRRHKESHQGIIYQCEFCNRHYSQKAQCNMHKRRCEMNPNAGSFN